MRVFLDANILFSAAKSDGAIRALLSILARGGAVLCVDAYVVEEARRNLAAKAPGSMTVLEDLLRTAETVPMAVHSPDLSSYGLPEKDRPVLAAAIRGRCGILLTGDKSHFGALYGKQIQGVTIVSPAQMGERLPGRRLK